MKNHVIKAFETKSDSMHSGVRYNAYLRPADSNRTAFVLVFVKETEDGLEALPGRDWVRARTLDLID